jgi:hypothetical protein
MRLWFATLLLAALTMGSPAHAQQSRFVVHAEVTPRATLEPVSAATIEVSAGDLQRGYVEPVALYRVRSNDPRGFLLQVRPRSVHAESVELAAVARPVVLGIDGVDVYHPWARGAQEVAVRVRVKLHDVTRPGRLALPVHVSVAAL